MYLHLLALYRSEAATCEYLRKFLQAATMSCAAAYVPKLSLLIAALCSPNSFVNKQEQVLISDRIIETSP